MNEVASGLVRPLFEDTRKRLVETGTRNRLVHVNRANTRGNVVNIVNERSDDVYEILSARPTMRFRAIGRDRDQEDDGIHLANADDEGFDTGRFSDVLLESRMGPDALQKRLLKIAREAKTAEEEQGVNILYLALGFLTWFEDKNSAVPREAPLVLLPVELVRNARTSTYDLRLRDDDLVTNLPLQQRLQTDFGIKLPALECDDGWRPSDYFNAVDAVIKGRNRWSIDRDGIQLGFFSFSKLLMYLDLDPEAWPGKSIEAHPLIRGLLWGGFDSEPPLFGPDTKLDEILPPARLFHVVDADASQAKVIEEVRAGRNLVVQGPPGTGKSQTITNIIAAAAQEGKTVLFVAEKMAALSVVYDRLVRHGLRDICLELHSKNVNKKAVLGELARTLNAGSAVPNAPDPPTELTEVRDRLNDIVGTLHAPLAGSDETAFAVLSRQIRYIGQGAPPPTLNRQGLELMTRSEASVLVRDIEKYGRLAAEAHPADHPFRGVARLDLEPVELRRLQGQMTMTSEAAQMLSGLIAEAAAQLGIDAHDRADWAELTVERLPALCERPALPIDTLRALIAAVDPMRLAQGLAAGAVWRATRDALDDCFVESAFETPAADLRGPIAVGIASFFARWRSGYRAASRRLAGLLKGPLPKGAAERLALVDGLSDVQRLRRRVAEDEAFCARALGDAWQGENTDFDGLVAALAWTEGAKRAFPDAPSEPIIALASMPDKLADLSDRLGKAFSAATEALAQVAATLVH